MGLRPNLHSDVGKKLRNIKSDFSAYWNDDESRWEIWDKAKWGRPYMVTPVWDENHQPIYTWGERVFRTLRRVMWEQTKEFHRKMAQYDNEMLARNERNEENTFHDMAKEYRREAQSEARRRGIIPGKAKSPWSPGFGG